MAPLKRDTSLANCRTLKTGFIAFTLQDCHNKTNNDRK